MSALYKNTISELYNKLPTLKYQKLISMKILFFNLKFKPHKKAPLE